LTTTGAKTRFVDPMRYEDPWQSLSGRQAPRFNFPATTRGLRIKRAKRFIHQQNFEGQCHRSCNRSTAVSCHRNLICGSLSRTSQLNPCQEITSNFKRARSWSSLLPSKPNSTFLLKFVIN